LAATSRPIAVEERREAFLARIDYEVGRARRYGGRVSVIALRATPTGTIDGNWQRFAATIARSLRDPDHCWVDTDRIILVLPETDLAASSHVMERAFSIAGLEALAIEASASTFPDNAPTSDALLESMIARESRVAR
jgi:hypothetical protein